MFESIEIRRVKNGFVLVINSEETVDEYVYDTSRKTMRMIKDLLELKDNNNNG